MENSTCDYKNGILPSCAPLALSYTPMQQAATPSYEPREALSRGTLFPALDLPLMNITNSEFTENLPLLEVMALDFVCNELVLYLDTHKDDKEAFAAFQSFLKLSDEAHMNYAQTYGPITRMDMKYGNTFTWLNNPWPWEYEEEN